jgi:hypothetical protein
MAVGAAQLLAPQAPAVGKAAFSISQIHACSRVNGSRRNSS